MKKIISMVLTGLTSIMVSTTLLAQTMTDFGTPRHETVVFQTFDGTTSKAGNYNTLMGSYNIWGGMRELGLSYLWETDTGTGKHYPELAAKMPEALDDSLTKFKITLKEGIYWSDGVEFTADDVIYTLDLYRKGKEIGLTYWGIGRVNNKIKSYKKTGKYTFEVESTAPTHRMNLALGVYTWGSDFNIQPKHILEKIPEKELKSQKFSTRATLGPYTVEKFDPNGSWVLWKRRDDWKRSGWGWMGTMNAKYVLWQDFGTEDKRIIAMIQNKYDADTFMSPDGIKATQRRNPNIKTFDKNYPFHNMDDACSWGILMNQQKAPLDKKNVRWALALSMDLKNVAINGMNGQVRNSPIPMVETNILRPVYFTPLKSFLANLTLDDGYKPYNVNFSQELSDALKASGAENLPSDPASFGLGWWKKDLKQAEKLLMAEGFKRNSDGKWLLPNGELWKLDFTFPADWNKILQRLGFSVADSWRKFGIEVNSRQTDNGEFRIVQRTNAKLEAQLMWRNCIFTTDWYREFQQMKASGLRPGDSTEENTENLWRVDNPNIEKILQASGSLDPLSEEFIENGRSVLKEMITNMHFINMMNIPTTSPHNYTYWTGWPTADNYYAVSYSWWSSVKSILATIKPTGKM